MERTRRPGERAWRSRTTLVLLVALLGLAAIGSGRVAAVLGGRPPPPHERLLRPSGEIHYLYLAQGWLAGRTHLDGKPPGWPQAHDYARIWTIEIADGGVLRGVPCQTEDCRAFTARTHEEVWWSLEEREWIDVPRRDIRRRTATWYVSFPPGPALALLPFVAAFGLSVSDVLFTLLLAAVIPLVVVSLLDRVRGTDDGRGREHLIAAAAWTFAGPACFLSVNGNVWFTAQILAALACFLYMDAAFDARRPASAGWWLGVAMACRPHLAFAAVLFALEWRRTGAHRRALIRFAVPFGLVGLALGLHNVARFESFFEFGHRFLDVRWQPRIQELGLFSLAYLPRNLECLLWLLPQSQAGFPWIRVSFHGMALPLTTPWLAAVAGARERFPQRGGLWLSALLVGLPPLFYQNSGQIQFTYRFALDWLPFALVALVLGGAFRRRTTWALAVAAALVHVLGAWMVTHRPGRIYVVDPLGWPFEEEIDGR